MPSTTSGEIAQKTMQHQNVAGGQLRMFSKDPPTGHFRDGFCRSGPEDTGNHTVAATMTQDFLDFTAGRGNNLKEVGIKSGMRWCLCAHRWREAMQAAQDGQISQETVPKVYLHASGKAALDTVSYKDLKKYAVQEAGESQRQGGEHRPEGVLGVARESQEIGGDMPTETPGAGKWQGTGRKGEIVEVQSSRG